MIQQGERVRLSPLDRRHLDKMAAWQTDADHRNIYRDFLFPWSPSEWTQFFETRLLYSQDQRIFVVEEKSGTEPVGYVSLLNINWVARTCEVAMLVEARFRHRGYALETLLVISDYLFLKLSFRKWYMRVVADTSLAGALRGVGFKEEGVLAGHVFFDGRYHDEAILSMWTKDHRALIQAVRSQYPNVVPSSLLDRLDAAAKASEAETGGVGKA